MKAIKAKCGGKKSGCCADIILPYGISKHVSDNSASQNQAGSNQTQTSK